MSPWRSLSLPATAALVAAGCPAPAPPPSASAPDAAAAHTATPAVTDAGDPALADAGGPRPAPTTSHWRTHCAHPVPQPPPAAATITSNPFETSVFIAEGHGWPCAIVEDLDSDGALDLATLRAGDSSFHVYWGPIDEGSAVTGVVLPEYLPAQAGCAVLDADDDGRLDVLIGSSGAVVGVYSDGPRSFEVWPDVMPIPPAAPLAHMLVLVPLDLDGVPPLDLLFGGPVPLIQDCGLYGLSRDPGGGRDIFALPHGPVDGWFAMALGRPTGLFELTTEVPFPSDPRGMWLTAAAADFNCDGTCDLALGRDFDTNLLALSDGVRSWSDATAASGIEVPNHAMGAATGDFDGDGRADLYVGDAGPDQLWLATGCGTFTDGAQVSQVAALTDRTVSWGVVALDVDHNGALDLFGTDSMVVVPGGFAPDPEGAGDACPDPVPAAAHPEYLLVNAGGGIMSRVDVPRAADYPPTFNYNFVAAGDLDGDGDVDVVSSDPSQTIRIHRNQAEKSGTWLQVRPVDHHHRPVRGARVEVIHPGGGVRFVELWGSHGASGHSALTAHFGLGDEPGPVEVVVHWPDGATSEHGPLAVGQIVTVPQPLP